jgi:transcription elongation GreA/GreB family factor
MNRLVALCGLLTVITVPLRGCLVEEERTCAKNVPFPAVVTALEHEQMSRAFVKEQDVDYLALPERPVSEHPNDVTEAGLAQIEDALAKASEAYAIAQAAADRASLAAAGRELRYWTARRATARIVPAPADRSEVWFGAAVTIRRDDGREQTFRIVGEDEADPAKGSISHVSPLAKSMFGKRVGDVVRAGNGEAEIEAISYGPSAAEATQPTQSDGEGHDA